MADPAPAPAPSPTPPAPPPWHAGIEPEILGHWQNKGWKIEDPKEVALAATKQAREAEKFFGVPNEQLLKMPKADAKPEDIKAFWSRLGAADAKDYDLSGIKYGDGTDLDAGFADAMRGALAAAFVPKDKAGTIVGAVLKYLEDADSAEGAITAGKIAQEKATLQANWKNSFDFNHLKAMEGARRLGITPEAVKALEGQIGYAAVMEAMRKIGSSTSEDTFVERGATSGGVPTTREGAMARKAELMRDSAWANRYLAGGASEANEMNALNIMIDGAA